MTKSGIGTTLSPLPQSQSSTTTITSTSTTTQHQLNMREIPIWVNDKKKWVTGISKKTTIDDIIYAILKQCNINCDYDTIINDYVLFEILYDQPNTILSERILKGNSKVYKYLSKWLEQTNKFLLKVKKCEYYTTTADTATDNNNSTNRLTPTCTDTFGHNNGSLSKLFKKLTVNTSMPTGNQMQMSQQQQLNTTQLLRYVDVKLPTCSSQVQSSKQPKSGNQDTRTSTGDHQQLPYKQYDPTLQKSLIISNIMDKDRKLSQQFERVKLLDELVKEAEKMSQLNDATYLVGSTSAMTASLGPFNIDSLTTKTTSNIQTQLTLNDVYSTFPEMYTQSKDDVQEFYELCLKLLSLDDHLTTERNKLQKTENDLQMELNMVDINNSSQNTPETMKLKNDIYQSREQTRVQCKELHDLDLRMRHNDSLLINKEFELKQLLEELYLYELDDIKLSPSSNENSKTELLIQQNAKLKALLNISPKQQQSQSNDHCDNDSGISSMSSENTENQQISQQKSVMETLV